MSAYVRDIKSDTVDAAVEEAAKAACDVLDQVFPGFDAGGITSNFQGSLADAIRQLLCGGGLIRTSSLPVLATRAGDCEFLVANADERPNYGFAYQPGFVVERPWTQVTEAWSTREEATAHMHRINVTSSAKLVVLPVRCVDGLYKEVRF